MTSSPAASSGRAKRGATFGCPAAGCDELQGPRILAWRANSERTLPFAWVLAWQGLSGPGSPDDIIAGGLFWPREARRNLWLPGRRPRWAARAANPRVAREFGTHAAFRMGTCMARPERPWKPRRHHRRRPLLAARSAAQPLVARPPAAMGCKGRESSRGARIRNARCLSHGYLHGKA